MSIGSFMRWLDVASSDGEITASERAALCDRAKQLGISVAEADLLIEQRRQQLKLEPPKCPQCGHRLSSASITMLCPQCNADVGRARSKQEDTAGIIESINALEEAVQTLTATHLPVVIIPGRFNHSRFQQLRSDVESRIDRISVRYRDSAEVRELIAASREKLHSVIVRYDSSKRRMRYAAIVFLALFTGNYAYQSFMQSRLEARGYELQSTFKELLDRGKYEDARTLLNDAKTEYKEVSEELTSDGARTAWKYFDDTRWYYEKEVEVDERVIELSNRAYSSWIEPIRERLAILCQKGDYDSCFSLVDKISRDYTKFPTYPDRKDTKGPLGEEHTIQNIKPIIEQNEDCILMWATERHDYMRIRQVLSRVPDEWRRTRLLKKALILAVQTGRLDVRDSLQALIDNSASITPTRYIRY